MESAKRKQKPCSEYDKQLLIQLVQAKINTIDNRKTDGISLRKKSEAWEEITSQFNNSNVTQIADTKQIKKMWQNLKTKARDAKTLEAQRKRTGGGPTPPDMGPLESQVIAVMPNVLPAISVEIDSDTLAIDSTLGLDNDEQMWLPKRARVSDVEHNNNIEIELEDIQKENLMPITIGEPSTIPSAQYSDPKKQAKEKKTFDELKQELILQELKYNKERYEDERRRNEEKYLKETEFLEKKRALELEILEIKKEKENILKNEAINE